MPATMPGIATAEGGAREDQVKGASAASSVKAASAVEFDHLAIYVHDVERSAAFYEKVMGLERIPEPFHDGLHVWLQMGPGVALHVVGGAPATTAHAINDHFAFRMASLDGFMAKLDGLHIAYRNIRGMGRLVRGWMGCGRFICRIRMGIGLK